MSILGLSSFALWFALVPVWDQSGSTWCPFLPPCPPGPCLGWGSAPEPSITGIPAAAGNAEVVAAGGTGLGTDLAGDLLAMA